MQKPNNQTPSSVPSFEIVQRGAYAHRQSMPRFITFLLGEGLLRASASTVSASAEIASVGPEARAL